MNMNASVNTSISVRHSHLREILREENLDALALNPGPSLTYLTGLHFHVSERPVVFLLPVSGVPRIVLPELEAQKLQSADFEIGAHTYTEDPKSWQIAFSHALSTLNGNLDTVGIEPRHLRVLELRLLEGADSGIRYVSGESAVARLRMQKDEEELDLMREATLMAEKALLETIPALKAGISEREIAALLVRNMLENGSSGELPFQPIIAFGANSANPHAVPTDYRLQKGDLVLFDWGANNRGYFSDLTRMFAFGEPEDELRRIVEIVLDSNIAGRKAVRPGIPAGDIDRASRGVIDAAGYGDRFIHRTGHGLGLEIHEEPYMRDDNERLLEVGMTFTVEPGIYLPGRGGARIEDDMVVTDDGGVSLSTVERGLQILGA